MKNIKEYEAMAKLDLPETERKWISDQADKMTAGFDTLEKIDTSGTEPLVTVLEINNIMRDDIVRKFIKRDELLSGAPEQYNGYFQAPKTLE